MKPQAPPASLWNRSVLARNLRELSEDKGDGLRISHSTGVQEEQLRGLVQQLFFRQEFPPVRHVALAAPDREADLGQLSLNLAKVLADGEDRTVGVIHTDSIPLGATGDLRSVPGSPEMRGTEVSTRLWVVPPDGWRHELDTSIVSDQNLFRLRQVVAEFDFSILTCPPVGWVIARVAQTCDGAVLVVTANKTRRLVAAQMRDHLRSAGIPILGSVLAGRRFPVPEGLYRKL